MAWQAPFALLLALLGGLQGAPPTRTGASVEVHPATVAVGEPFTVRVRVRAMPGAVIRFPAVPDSAGAIEALDPRAIEDSSTSAAFDQTAVYRFIAWEPGRRSVPLGVVSQDVARGAIAFPVDPHIEVVSLLPADTAEQAPRAARAPLDAPPLWWRWVLVALAVVAIVVMSWVAWRRRRATARPVDPFADAQSAFAAIDELGLVDAGEPGRAVLAYAEVMRDYLARRFPMAIEGLTTPEFVSALESNALPIHPDEVADVLVVADAVKFAGVVVDADAVRQVARAARGVVLDVQTAHEARLAATDKGKGPRGRRRRA